MEHLLEAAQSDSVGAIWNAVADFPQVHAVSIGSDWMWRLLNRARPLLGDDDYGLLSDALRVEAASSPTTPWSFDREDYWLTALAHTGVDVPVGKSTWRDPIGWPFVQPDRLGGSRTVVTISIDPARAAGVIADLRGVLREVGTDDARVEIRARPRARLTSAGAEPVHVTGGNPIRSRGHLHGTAGGVLGDGHGGALVPTAGHVVMGASELSVDASQSGTSTSIHLQPRVQSQLTPLDGALNAATAQSCTDVDFALLEPTVPIELHTDVGTVGPVDDIAMLAGVNEGDLVDVTGAVTGSQTLRVGDLDLCRSFDHAGMRWGYRHLFALRRVSRFWAATGTLRPPIRHGDSGGWITQQMDGRTLWAGSVVGGDGAIGYACFAERIQEQTLGGARLTRSATGLSL
ncbi:MAG: hypothetical protein U0Q22_03755 [Acidimicrobiales bacterium]